MSVVQYENHQDCDIEPVAMTEADDAPLDGRISVHQAAFHLFLLINATLFLRPSEIVPALDGWPIYEVLNVFCIALCLPRMVNQLTRTRLTNAPIVACVIGLLFAVTLSELSHLNLDSALTAAVEFLKVVAYFLMLVTVVDSLSRLRIFMLALLWFTAILTALALLHFHGFINIPAMEAAREMWSNSDGDGGEILRLCAAGIYGNPNDLARILIVGMFLAVYFATAKQIGPTRFLWIAAFLMMGYALQLTNSRGGLLALMAGLALLFKMRFGWGKFLLASFVATPVFLIAFSGRQLELSTSSGTGQQRIRLWSEGLSYLRSAPLFGIGMNRYQEYVGLAAHNSFVQCFVDLGLFGGTFFVSAFLLALWGIYRAGRASFGTANQDLHRMRPYLIAIIGSSVVGMFSSTRSYTIPTYTILGMAACFLHISWLQTGQRQIPLTWKLAGRLMAISIASLVGIYVYVRLFAVWD